jgi:hypothetical protein
MLRRIMNIPEGVYYRGRFRATTAWSKVSKKTGRDDSEAVVDGGKLQGVDVPDRLGTERRATGRKESTSLHMRPVER